LSDEEKEFMEQQSMEFGKSKKEIPEVEEKENKVKKKEMEEDVKEKEKQENNVDQLDLASSKIKTRNDILATEEISPRCYISDKIEIENVSKEEKKENKVSTKRHSKDPTLMQSTESMLKNSLGYSQLNVEEENKFIGNSMSKSKMKEITSESESEDDETMMSQFNKSYLTRNSDHGEKKNKFESTKHVSKKEVNQKDKWV
jgi:hypothetical protein